MGKEKTPPYKSFGAIPREKFASSATADSNKIASFKEDMYNLSRQPEDDEAFEYKAQVPEPEVPPVSESSVIASLRKRITYYENDTLEDPNIREMQLRQLKARMQEALNNSKDSAATEKKPAQEASAKKTGWWDKNLSEKSEVTAVAPEEDSTSALANDKDPQQMKDQMGRLVKVTGRLRKEAGLSDSEALEESPDYKELKSEISRIRYRLNKILEEKGKEQYKEEITQLRHELATHLVAFKKLSRERAVQEAVPEGEFNGHDEVNFLAGDKPEEADVPVPESSELKNYEKRRLARDEWRRTKDVYMNAYEQHLSDIQTKNAQKNVFSKMAFWKKEGKSPALIAAEEAYQEARNKYAEGLDSALGSRVKRVSISENEDASAAEDQVEGLRAGLANRFVLSAAHEKLAKEKVYLPNPKSLRFFEKLQGALKEHRTLIKRSGYVVVFSIGLVSGGVGAAILALGSKAVNAKLAAVSTLGGATMGAYLGNSLSNTVIDYTGQRRDSAAQRAQRKFSLETMDKREKEYIERYRSHEKALRDKNFYIGVGTLAGGTLGAIAGGNLDNVTDVELPESLPVPPQAPLTLDIPEVVIPAPEEIPEPIIPQEPVLPQMLEDDGADIDESKIDNFPKEGLDKNASDAPEAPSKDVTYFEPYVAPQETEIIPKAVPEPAEDAVVEHPELLHTFEFGDRVNTVSEALFEAWKDNNDNLEEHLTKKQFLAEMYTAIAEIEKDPELNTELLEQMGITSGDIDEVDAGQTIDLHPFFEYMNQKK